MPNSPRILIVEDSDNDVDLLLRELRRGGIESHFERVDSAEGVKAALTRGPWDIVISDYGLPRHDFSDVLKAVREHDPQMPFIVVSGSIGEENAIALMREGVADFVFKGNLSRLIPAIHRELAAAAQQQARREADQRFRDIVEVSGDWIWETDAEHRYTFFSDRLRRGRGDRSRHQPRQDKVGARRSESRGRRGLAGASRGSQRRGDPSAISSSPSSMPSGSRRHVSMSGVPVFDRGGGFCGYRGTATDETRVVEAFWRAEEGGNAAP